MFRTSFDDAFFGDMHRMMHNQMRDMETLMDAMMDPFAMMGGRAGYANPRQQMISDHGAQARHHANQQQGIMQHQHRDPMSALMPFGFGFGGGGLFGGFQNMMQQMETLQHQALNDPQSQVFTQSSVISIQPGPDGRPQVYEATDSVRKAGDVKETRRTVRDGQRGVDKIAIGHHIGDRGHVIEKRRDRNADGQIREQQEFIGMTQNDAKKFDAEWSRATRHAARGNMLEEDVGRGNRVGPRLAIEDRSDRRQRNASPYGVRGSREPQQSSSRTSQPSSRRRAVRIEEYKEDPRQPVRNQPSSSNGGGSGPIIEEVD